MASQALAARNVHKEPGRAISVNDVIPYARPGCQKCRGKGIVGYRKVGETRGAEPCACATKRFWKAHPEIIVTEKGLAFWPSDEAPEQLAALKAARKSLEDGPAADAIALARAADPIEAAGAGRELAMVHGLREPPAGTTVHHLHSGQTACTFGRA